MSDYMKEYEEHWKELVETDGKIDKDKVAKELHDFWFMIGNTTTLMHDATLGRVSKPMTTAQSVMGVIEDLWLNKGTTQDDVAMFIDENTRYEGLVDDLKEYFGLDKEYYEDRKMYKEIVDQSILNKLKTEPCTPINDADQARSK